MGFLTSFCFDFKYLFISVSAISTAVLNTSILKKWFIYLFFLSENSYTINEAFFDGCKITEMFSAMLMLYC